MISYVPLIAYFASLTAMYLVGRSSSRDKAYHEGFMACFEKWQRSSEEIYNSRRTRNDRVLDGWHAPYDQDKERT